MATTTNNSSSIPPADPAISQITKATTADNVSQATLAANNPVASADYQATVKSQTDALYQQKLAAAAASGLDAIDVNVQNDLKDEATLEAKQVANAKYQVPIVAANAGTLTATADQVPPTTAASTNNTVPPVSTPPADTNVASTSSSTNTNSDTGGYSRFVGDVRADGAVLDRFDSSGNPVWVKTAPTTSASTENATPAVTAPAANTQVAAAGPGSSVPPADPAVPQIEKSTTASNVSQATLAKNDPATFADYQATVKSQSDALYAQKIAESPFPDDISEQNQLRDEANLEAKQIANAKYQDQIAAAGAGNVVATADPVPPTTAASTENAPPPVVAPPINTTVAATTASTGNQSNPYVAPPVDTAVATTAADTGNQDNPYVTDTTNTAVEATETNTTDTTNPYDTPGFDNNVAATETNTTDTTNPYDTPGFDNNVAATEVNTADTVDPYAAVGSETGSVVPTTSVSTADTVDPYSAAYADINSSGVLTGVLNSATTATNSAVNTSNIPTSDQLAADQAAAQKQLALQTAQIQAQRKQANDGDWRVKLRLAGGSQYLYNNPDGPGILQPLQVTGGVIFPYTPVINTSYKANYSSYDLTHSNYKGYFYQGSSVGEIRIQAMFTAQDTNEANYLLAVIHFFRSATKMFYGQDTNYRGSPPPLVFLQGLGTYQFNLHPCVIAQFDYNLPGDVDYIRATSVSNPGTNLNDRRAQQNLPTNYTGTSQTRLANNNLTKGAISGPPAASTLQVDAPTYVPTKMEIGITLLPVQTRQQVSQQFSLAKFANGDLIKGGFW